MERNTALVVRLVKNAPLPMARLKAAINFPKSPESLSVPRRKTCWRSWKRRIGLREWQLLPKAAPPSLKENRNGRPQ